MSTVQTIAVVILTVAASLAFLIGLHRVWPSEQRRQHNDTIGWQVSVLGTTYAVIIGFMLYAVWTNFEEADINAEAEANCLVNVVRAADALPAAERQQIRNLARDYVNIMLTQEWPAMNRMRLAPASHRVIEQLWATVTGSAIQTSSEQVSLEQTLAELRNTTEHRRIRELQMASSLPGILWTVLILGAITTIVSACLFGSSDFKLQMIQVFMLSLLISLLLVTVADINRPFQGAVRVAPAGFERARTTLDALMSESR